MAQYYVGVDVGGTTVKMGMFSDTGELLDKWEIPTRRKNNGKYILSDIVDSIEEKRETFEGNIKGIGVGIPGPVTADGTVLKCANLGWDVFSVSNKLASLTGVGNVKVGNDANVAALGEMWKGGGRGYDSNSCLRMRKQRLFGTVCVSNRNCEYGKRKCTGRFLLSR